MVPLEIKDQKVKPELMVPGDSLALLDLLVLPAPMEIRVNLVHQDLQVAEEPEESLVLVVSLVQPVLRASLDLRGLRASLVPRVIPVSLV